MSTEVPEQLASQEVGLGRWVGTGGPRSRLYGQANLVENNAGRMLMDTRV